MKKLILFLLPLFAASLSFAGGLKVSDGRSMVAGATVIDAYNPSFGPVSAASTSTITWTEGYDRTSEFVTSSFTVVNSGQYEIIVHAGISQTAGTGCLILKVGGASFAGGTVCNQGVTALASVLDLSMTRILNLSAGNILRVDASATTADATFLKTNLTIKRIL